MSRAAPVDASMLLAGAMSEKQLQVAVVDLARLLGWRPFHVYDSRRSAAGYPDLVLCRPPRLLFCELKSERGRLRLEQRAWLVALRACPGVEVFVWRPAQWRSGEVEAILRGACDRAVQAASA